MKKLFCLSVLVLGSFVTHARADDSLTNFENALSPCSASALEAAAVKAKTAGSDFMFSSFGPQTLNANDEKVGANEAYWVGFTDNESHKINYRVSVYCQQGGWKSVVAIVQQ